MQNINILKMPEAILKTGLSRCTIISLIKIHEFPQPVRLASRRVGFIEQEVNEFLLKRMQERVEQILPPDGIALAKAGGSV